MSDDQKRYQVYEDDGDEHGYTRLNKLETDSIIEAVSYQHRRGAHGIMRYDPDHKFDNGWLEMSAQETTTLFFDELKSLMQNGKDMETRKLMGESFTTPPPEFMNFMRENFPVHSHPERLFQIINPYHSGITISGDTINLVVSSLPKVEQP